MREAIRFWGHGSYRVDPEEHLHEAHWLNLDCSKARIELGWVPRYNIEKALDLTVKWYRKFYGRALKEVMMEVSVKQIEMYDDALQIKV